MLLYFIFNLFPDIISASPCPEDFILEGDQCLYVNIIDSLTWFDAKDVCTSMGAGLLMPKDGYTFMKFANDNYSKF